jgi:hypothetical protein
MPARTPHPVRQVRAQPAWTPTALASHGAAGGSDLLSGGPKILAIDPGRVCGVCIGRPGTVPALEQWDLELDREAPEDVGAALLNFETMLVDALTDVEEVVMEAPYVPRSFVDINALRLLFGICGLIEARCHERHVQVREEQIARVRSALFGPAPAGSAHKKVTKADMMRAVKACGLSPRSQHQADAGAVWLTRVFQLDDLSRRGGAWRRFHSLTNHTDPRANR